MENMSIKINVRSDEKKSLEAVHMLRQPKSGVPEPPLPRLSTIVSFYHTPIIFNALTEGEVDLTHTPILTYLPPHRKKAKDKSSFFSVAFL